MWHRPGSCYSRKVHGVLGIQARLLTWAPGLLGAGKSPGGSSLSADTEEEFDLSRQRWAAWEVGERQIWQRDHHWQSRGKGKHHGLEKAQEHMTIRCSARRSQRKQVEGSDHKELGKPCWNFPRSWQQSSSKVCLCHHLLIKMFHNKIFT